MVLIGSRRRRTTDRACTGALFVLVNCSCVGFALRKGGAPTSDETEFRFPPMPQLCGPWLSRESFVSRLDTMLQLHTTIKLLACVLPLPLPLPLTSSRTDVATVIVVARHLRSCCIDGSSVPAFLIYAAACPTPPSAGCSTRQLIINSR